MGKFISSLHDGKWIHLKKSKLIQILFNNWLTTNTHCNNGTSQLCNLFQSFDSKIFTFSPFVFNWPKLHCWIMWTPWQPRSNWKTVVVWWMMLLLAANTAATATSSADPAHVYTTVHCTLMTPHDLTWLLTPSKGQCPGATPLNRWVEGNYLHNCIQGLMIITGYLSHTHSHLLVRIGFHF